VREKLKIFPSLNWPSREIVRFEIEVGVYEEFVLPLRAANYSSKWPHCFFSLALYIQTEIIVKNVGLYIIRWH